MNNHTIIIAEAGVNHNGSIEIAKELIREAAKAGVDYIKFQTFKAEKCVSKFAEKADYQKENTNNKFNIVTYRSSNIKCISKQNTNVINWNSYKYHIIKYVL